MKRINVYWIRKNEKWEDSMASEVQDSCYRKRDWALQFTRLCWISIFYQSIWKQVLQNGLMINIRPALLNGVIKWWNIRNQLLLHVCFHLFLQFYYHYVKLPLIKTGTGTLTSVSPINHFHFELVFSFDKLLWI